MYNYLGTLSGTQFHDDKKYLPHKHLSLNLIHFGVNGLASNIHDIEQTFYIEHSI